MKGIALWLVAKLLTFCLYLPSLVHTVVDGIRYGGFWKRINETFFDAAYAQDVYGNTAYRSLLNALLIKKGGYHYGHRKEAVSSATGKGQVLKKQTVLGEGLAGFLALLDPGHSYRSIEADGYEFDGWHLPEPAPVAWWKTLFFTICFAATLVATCMLWWWLLVMVVKWLYPLVV